MGSVKFRFEEEGIVPFGGVNGDVHRVNAGLFEVLDELGLFFGVKAEIGIDGENEELLSGFLAA